MLAAVLAVLAAPAVASAQPAPPPDAAPKDAAPTKDAPTKDAPPPEPSAKRAEPPPPDKPAPPPADAEPAKPPPPPTPEPAKEPPSGFTFGSYGRVMAATDFHGRPGRDADIVAHGSRLDEGNYVELYLSRDDYWKKTASKTRLLTTLAISNPVFHYNGEFNIKMALRNLFIEEHDLGLKGLSFWAGSRMYRGDDIYLLDWWPLDNSNTVGGGARYDIAEKTFAAVHGGLSMPSSIFYLQDTQRNLPFNQLGSTSVNILERQRFIGSLKVSHTIPIGQGGLKLIGYAEAHRLPSGQKETSPRVFADVHSDGGFVIGAQVGFATGERDSHVNLFLRYASGLAAYGDFATPSQLNTDGTTAGAHELLAAIGGIWEAGPFGLMVGGYLRSFRDASKDLDFGDVDEGILVLRPHLFFGEFGGLALEGSYQAMQRGVVTLADADGKPSDSTGPFSASLFRFGVIPFLSPAGRGDYSRPHFRVIYVVTARGKNARMLYPQDDVFSIRSVEHFFGFGAEWWFNTST